MWIAGLAMFVGLLMSPNGWAWWMDVHSVQGREMDGLVYYSVNGVKLTLNDPQSFAGSKPRERTVYFLSSDPADGALSNTGNQLLDWGLTAGPGAIGLVLLAAGFAKRQRRNRPGVDESAQSFGHGIPSEMIRALTPRNNPKA